MTYRERKEARIARRLEWAASRETRAAQEFAQVRRLADSIPFGQPILVGHHSERHARKDAARIHNGMERASESQAMATHHAQVAAGIQDQLNRSIYSDDRNAIEALEQRIAERESTRDRMKLVNKLYKKGDVSGLAALGLDFQRVKAGVNRQSEDGRLSWLTAPHPAYEITNIGATIRTDKKRLDDIKARQERTASAEAAGGLLVEPCGEYTRVTFTEKPARAILDSLRAAGFTWGGGSWVGRTDKLPNLAE